MASLSLYMDAKHNQWTGATDFETASPICDSKTMGVTNPDTVRERLTGLHDTQHLSWRLIAALPEFVGVPAGTLCTWSKTGYLPRKHHARFGWTVTVDVPVCPIHGTVHCYDCSREIVKPKHKPRTTPRPPRIAIRLDDPTSAAASILAHMTPWTVTQLIELLEQN